MYPDTISAVTDLHENKGPHLLAASIVIWSLASLLVFLRIFTRRLRQVSLGLDDWAILASLVPSCGHVFGIVLYPVSRGFGKHIWDASPDGAYAMALGTLIAEISYALNLTFVKISILAFYWRLFGVMSSIKALISVLTAVSCIWFVVVVILSLLQCQPTRAIWDQHDPVHPMQNGEYSCSIHAKGFWLGNAIPNIITDICLLILPIPYLLRLRLPKTDKISVLGIFLIGILVTTVSIFRLTLLLEVDLEDPDITWNFFGVGLWSVIEGNVAIICGAVMPACLPFMKPLLWKSRRGTGLERKRHEEHRSLKPEEYRCTIPPLYVLDSPL